MFNPNYALFKPSAADNVTFQPNPNSRINPDHLLYFKFIGRIIGKALFDGQMLDAYFTRSFYKHMLGVPVSYQDMEAIDPEYYKNLRWILENDITNVLDHTFSIEKDEFGVVKVEDLKPGGRNIPVTEENKIEYVKLITEMKMTTAIKEQIEAFLSGFHELVPKALISIFNEHELELLISGLPDIDVEDLRANTEYVGYTTESPVIQWFWNVVTNMSREEKANLIQFVTGTSKVPLDGFKVLQGMSGLQKFQIHRIRGKTERLPSAHTCFNQLDLPEYDSIEILEKNIKTATCEGAEGFGFG
jgi:E3 ubiquitin-protein ligase HUWE1